MVVPRKPVIPYVKGLDDRAYGAVEWLKAREGECEDAGYALDGLREIWKIAGKARFDEFTKFWDDKVRNADSGERRDIRQRFLVMMHKEWLRWRRDSYEGGGLVNIRLSRRAVAVLLT